MLDKIPPVFGYLAEMHVNTKGAQNTVLTVDISEYGKGNACIGPWHTPADTPTNGVRIINPPNIGPEPVPYEYMP